MNETQALDNPQGKSHPLQTRLGSTGNFRLSEGTRCKAYKYKGVSGHKIEPDT